MVVVDTRVFLLGLDGLYREAMKQHERGELLECARKVAAALGVSREKIPIEGYYAEDPKLTEYFELVRALQEVGESRGSSLQSMPALRRLLQVTSSRLFGLPEDTDKLLPRGRDPLYFALKRLWERRQEWTVPGLTAEARRAAEESDDFSLVGLAARAADPILIAALRESVVLYAAEFYGRASPARPEYLWQVDPAVAAQARRFVDTFNGLFGETLPAPEASNAAQYFRAHLDNDVAGRCVRIGVDDSDGRLRHYHWAIPAWSPEDGVEAFWDTEVWTSERYRESRGLPKRNGTTWPNAVSAPTPRVSRPARR